MKKPKKAEKEDDFEEIVEDSDNAGDIVKKLRTQLKECQKEKQEYLDGWQRSKADSINARKKEETTREEISKFAKEDLMTEMLLVLDSFEMAIGNKTAWEKVDANWRRGVEHIYAQFLSILKDNHLTQISPDGEPFDPTLHDSLESITVEDKKQDGIIIEVLQKGYTFYDKVIRPAKVKVGKLKK